MPNALRAAFHRLVHRLRRQYLAEDTRYHVPGRGPLAGDYEGAAQVIELFRRPFELSGGTVRLTLHDVLANNEHAVALYTVRAERAGRQLEDNQVQIVHTHDGKATESWLHLTDIYFGDEFWS